MPPLVQLARQRLREADQLARSSLTFDRIKTLLFLYVVLSYSIKVERHLWARGPIRTLRDLVKWVAQRATMLALQLPSNKRYVASEMSKVRVDIETKLVPSGAGVSRHLALPHKGQTADWIAEEMGKMDKEMAGAADYRDGKLSGAVYRALHAFAFSIPAQWLRPTCRRRRGHAEARGRRVRAILRLKPASPGRVPGDPENGGRGRLDVPEHVQQPQRSGMRPPDRCSGSVDSKETYLIGDDDVRWHGEHSPGRQDAP
jgi:hypothetical protein